MSDRAVRGSELSEARRARGSDHEVIAAAPAVRRPLLAFAGGAVVVWAIASVAFVAHRNREHERRELDRADRAARAVAEGKEPLAAVVASGVVEPARASSKYSFLRRRRLWLERR